MPEVAQKRTQVATFLDLYRSMRTTRAVEALEQDFTRRGEAFFYVSCAGHEAAATLAPHLIEEDWLQAHYRDKALLLARGMSVETLFLALFAKDASESRGRAMNAIMSDADHRVMGMPGRGGQRRAARVRRRRDDQGRPGAADRLLLRRRRHEPAGRDARGDPHVGCARAAGALGRAGQRARDLHAHQRAAPSSRCRAGDQDVFCGIPIRRIDGHDIIGAYRAYGEIVDEMRETRKPAIVILRVERLDSHSNADDQTLYRTAEEIDEVRQTADPLALFEESLEGLGVKRQELERIKAEIAEQVKSDALRAQRSGGPLRDVPRQEGAAPRSRGPAAASTAATRASRGSRCSRRCASSSASACSATSASSCSARTSRTPRATSSASPAG